MVQRFFDDEGGGEIGAGLAAAVAQALVVDAAFGGVERDAHAAEFVHAGVELGFHRLGGFTVGGIVKQILRFVRIGLEIVELVDIPEAVVADEFVAVAAQGEDGGGLREVFLPVVNVEEGVAPRRRFAAGEGQEVQAVHVGGRLEAHGRHDGGADVEIGDDLVDHAAAGEEGRTLHEHGDADRRFVGDAFVDEAVLAEHEAVVAHVENEGVVVDAEGFEFGDDAADAVVHGEEGFAVAAVVIGDVEVAVVGEIDAVPGVALVAEPAGFAGVILRGVGGGGGQNEVLVGEFSLVTGCRGEVGVDGFVREIDEEWFLGGLLLA